mmetsp:Transcript_7459/g.8575  ORF Transcript_7459/g.8575 Transcript_7459/m.8575 type:complete len:388 (-) Transcript_7459:1224-2387(-)
MFKKLVIGTAGSASAVLGYGVFAQDEWVYSNLIMPVVHRVLDGEDAHRFAVWAASKKLFPKSSFSPTESLMETRLLNLKFPNPLGMAAGFDKDGEGVEGIARLGFGFVEIGSVTPLPQPGNERPRVFRLNEDKAVINRYGFNSSGHEKVYENLQEYKKMKETDCVLGINLGKNKTSPSAVEDYSKGVHKFAGLADYLVVNVSSPNTPGLRNLQAKAELKKLIRGVMKARNLECKKGEKYCPPLLLKIAPDLSDKDKKDISDVVKEEKVDGLIVSNTTISRPDSLKNENKKETGGLSGAPLRELSTKTVKDMYTLTKGTVPIIGVGGIGSGADALEKIKAGASLVQVYSAITYQGPVIAKSILQELEELVKESGKSNVSELVGESANI